MVTPTTPTTLGHLFLVRLLLPLGKRPSRSLLQRGLFSLFKERFRHSEWREVFDATLARLESDDLVTPMPLGLTDAGRAAALAFLGVDTLRASLTWKEVRDRYLVPHALGVPAADRVARERIADADGLRAHILRRKYDLPATAGGSFVAAVNALVWKELGFEPEPDLDLNKLRARVLARVLDAPADCGLKELKQRLPAHAIQAKGGSVESLRQALLQGWIDDLTRDLSARVPGPVPADLPPATQPEPEVGASVMPPPLATGPFPLSEFAERVQQIANECDSGLVGDNKVFISHVWDRLHREQTYPGMTFEAFKDHLCQAHHQNLLLLSHGDVPESVGLGDVQASESWYGSRGAFHFIQLRRESFALA